MIRNKPSQQLCDDEKLIAVLSDGDQAAQHQEVVEHIEQCSRCQQRFDELAAGAQDWTKARQALLNDDPCSENRVGSAKWDYSLRNEGPVAWTESMASQLLSPASHPELLGRIGRYDVERLIGSGGMGVVFKAHDSELNRPVAIKILAPYLSSSGPARKRFAREARAAAAVVHEHVVPIYNVETERETPFLVMHYIAGESLQGRIDREGALELCEILRIGMQVAFGLSAAHQQGLVHRDIKPSNILMEQGVERALITDFGLARAADDASLTRTGFHPGTPQYMSPEQAAGEQVDARSDLFSLGSVLYTMCTARPPFRAETSLGVLRRITDVEPRPIREINPNIPEWLCLLISRLMSKSPDSRIRNALEVAALLEQCLAHVQQPTSVPLPASLVPHAAGRRSIFNSTRKGMIAMIGTIGMTLLGMVLWQATEAPDISGQWTSEEWGTVVLEAKGSGEYEGTFTGSGRDKPAYDIVDIPVVTEGGFSTAPVLERVKSGTVQLKWSRLERRFNGTWGKGVARTGTMSLRLVDKEIRGGWTTDEDVQLETGTPLVGDLLWKRSVVTVADGGSVLMGGPKAANEVANTSRKVAPGEILVEIYGGRGIYKSLESRNDVGKLLLALQAVKGVTIDIHEDGEGDAVTKAVVHMPARAGEREKGAESTKQEASIRSIKIAIDQALRAHKVSNVHWRDGIGKQQYFPAEWSGDRKPVAPSPSAAPGKQQKQPSRTSVTFQAIMFDMDAELITEFPVGTLQHLGPTDFGDEFKQLIDKGRVTIVSRPQIRTQMGETSTVQIGMSIAVRSPDKREMTNRIVGETLLMTPREVDGEVVLDIQFTSEQPLKDVAQPADDVTLQSNTFSFRVPLKKYERNGVVLGPFVMPNKKLRCIHLVKDENSVDQQNASLSADRGLKKFLEANPKAISVPPQAASETAKSPADTTSAMPDTVSNLSEPDSPQAAADVTGPNPISISVPPQRETQPRAAHVNPLVGHWKLVKLADMPVDQLAGATVVIDEHRVKMHVPSQKGPHPDWRFTLGANGDLDLVDADDAKGESTSRAKYSLKGKTLSLAVNAKKGDHRRPESATGDDPQKFVLYIVLELDEEATSREATKPSGEDHGSREGNSPGPEKPGLSKTLQQLQGKWHLTRQIADDGDETATPRLSIWEFKGDRIIVRDDGPGGALLIKVDESHSPVHVEAVIETDDESGLGLLSVDGDMLILCLGKSQKTPVPESRPEKLQWVSGVWYMELRRVKPGETIVPLKPKSQSLPQEAPSISVPPQAASEAARPTTAAPLKVAATGKLELEVKQQEKLPPEKEAFTAWGKEVGGLQAGLGFKPGEKRVYTHGETVILVVRVRNVGREAVKFSYHRQFSPNELLPTVTDGEGKPVSIEALVIDIRPQWTEMTLPPGQESDLHELKLDLRPASESGKKSDLTLYGAGKFHLQHERMNGMFSPEQIKIDPNLDKLATGKLELEVIR